MGGMNGWINRRMSWVSAIGDTEMSIDIYTRGKSENEINNSSLQHERVGTFTKTEGKVKKKKKGKK